MEPPPTSGISTDGQLRAAHSALRERREEIPALAEHFLERFAREFNKGRLRLADKTMEYLVL